MNKILTAMQERYSTEGMLLKGKSRVVFTVIRLLNTAQADYDSMFWFIYGRDNRN